MPKLRALTKELMADAELVPARWLDDRRSPGKPPALSASHELMEYVSLAEDPAFRREVAAIVSSEGGFYWGIVAVREPTSLLFKLTASEVVAFLMGSSVLGSDPDSGAYLTAAWSSSMVASFLFNDVAESDEKYGDFVVEAISIPKWLESFGRTSRRPKASLPDCKELARLYRRGIWIAQLVQEDDKDSLPDLERTIRDASPLKLYEKEAKEFPKHPHLAAYWLLAHALLDRSELLADALKRTEKSKHPIIIDLRKKLPRLPQLLAKHRSNWTKKDFETLRGRSASA